MTVATLVALAAGTLVSEDLATIAGGELVRLGRLSALHATAACILGVYVGDLALWGVGRFFGPRLLRTCWVARRLDGARLEQISAQLDRHLAGAVLASRVAPGTRLPLYLAAGIVGRRPIAFASWAFLAVALWTPLLIGATVIVGEALARQVFGAVGAVVRPFAVAAVLLVALRITPTFWMRASRRVC